MDEGDLEYNRSAGLLPRSKYRRSPTQKRWHLLIIRNYADNFRAMSSGQSNTMIEVSWSDATGESESMSSVNLLFRHNERMLS